VNEIVTVAVPASLITADVTDRFATALLVIVKFAELLLPV
jgi:hypothetical protein